MKHFNIELTAGQTKILREIMAGTAQKEREEMKESLSSGKDCKNQIKKVIVADMILEVLGKT